MQGKRLTFVTVNVRYISGNISPFRELFDRAVFNSVRNRGLKKAGDLVKSELGAKFHSMRS